MRLTKALPSILGATLLATLSACGGDAAADPMALIQKGDYAAAIAAIEPQLKTVEKGTDAHKDLVIGYTEALSAENPGKAKDFFLKTMTEQKDFIDPADVKYVVNRMAKQGHLSEAIDVMDRGKKTWPEDETIVVVLGELQKAVESSGDKGALDKLKGLGYL
ncbi:hypothetical protein Poly30_08650 [Planctomycetes bacterium Poly30]|uniref:Tetratricopeptide repeat protein n=1 Tax=Saltatorellus ferox TaxID=2528018 RepID=A0A518EMP9_9BACT|nr:hypothetical protein Poly30_08650 [Planctomycetes bacterium Poly30]